jgi:hypothetical protein
VRACVYVCEYVHARDFKRALRGSYYECTVPVALVYSEYFMNVTLSFLWATE